MEPIRLYTREGQYLVTVQVPHFEPKAEVIFYGDRCFVHCRDGFYREAMPWVALNTPWREHLVPDVGAGEMPDAVHTGRPVR